jgi:hypothetical protein
MQQGWGVGFKAAKAAGRVVSFRTDPGLYRRLGEGHPCYIQQLREGLCKRQYAAPLGSQCRDLTGLLGRDSTAGFCEGGWAPLQSSWMWQ